MMELKVASRTQTDELRQPRYFHYYLLVDSVETPRFVCENYGVKIWEEGGESNQVIGITTSAARIDELIALLVGNTVGPTALPDVVSDWL